MISHSLTNENYFSPENNMKYMGSSQFKSFLRCEAQTLAELRGEYTREMTSSLLVGSFVDAHFEGTLNVFKQKHPEILKKDGSLKSEYAHAEYMIQRAERDLKFMQYMGGEKQKIMVGEIAGVLFKIKIDSYHPHCIVDLKCMKDFKSIWNEESSRREHFILSWGYHLQGAIYQEVVRQNTGKKLPFYIAGITKEKPEPRIRLYWVPDEVLEEGLAEVRSLAPRFQKIKNGEMEPMRCGDCNYCRFTETLAGPVNFLEECEVYEVE